MNMSLGLLASGTGIAGGLVGGLGAANALSGSAGFLTGARSLMNEEVYRNHIAEAIIREIDENRRESLSLLNSRYLSNALIMPKEPERQGRLRYERELERVTAKKEALQSVLLGLGVASSPSKGTTEPREDTGQDNRFGPK